MSYSRTAAAAGSAAAIAIGLLAGTTSSATAAPTCRGQEATHVGSSDQIVLRGTSGPDVVVTNDALSVRTFGGDDIVCVTGTTRVDVMTHSGDDLVDATGFDGPSVDAELHRGSDRYIGSPRQDIVRPGYRSRGDHDRVSTRRGRDTLHLPVLYNGRVTGSLGRGHDQLFAANRGGLARVGGGRGRDRVETTCDGCTGVSVRLDTGVLRHDGERRAKMWSFENARAYAVHRAGLHGTKTRNVLHADACYAEVYGRAGRDVLRHPRYQVQGCDRPRMRFFGQGGDDVLRGSKGPDRLYGGNGRDFAKGGAGRDVCRAERKRRCEA